MEVTEDSDNFSQLLQPSQSSSQFVEMEEDISVSQRLVMFSFLYVSCKGTVA